MPVCCWQNASILQSRTSCSAALRGNSSLLPRTVSLAEVQIQCVAQTILLHVIVGVDVEPVIVLIGADKCTEGSIHIEVRLQIKVELSVRFDNLLTEGKVLC